MLQDLNNNLALAGKTTADVVVVGAGLAGLLLASKLTKLGQRVVVLESGGEHQETERHPFNEVVQVGQSYGGADAGRFRCLGGTSTRWGGAMLPFIPCDLGKHTAGWDIDWPIGLDDIDEELAELERMFQVPEGPYLQDPTADASNSGFTLRSAKWPPFRMRNTAHVCRDEIAGVQMDVWLNATVSRFDVGADGKLVSVRALSPSGNAIEVTAPYFAIAAGAIETTRLLLLLDAQHDRRIFTPDGVLGRYFYDHLCAPAGTIAPLDRNALNAEFGMQFVGQGMRDRRLEPSEVLRKAERLPGAFAHVVPITEGNDGFTALRAIYRDVQRRAPIRMHDVGRVALDFGWFAKAVWWRLGKRRLLASSSARFELYLNIEQMPDADNCITLSPDRRDPFGNPLAQIDWRVGKRDVEAFRRLQSALIDHWSSGEYAALGTVTATAEETWRSRLLANSDIFHPGGTTRMGTSRTTGVLDQDLKTFQIDNLYAISTAAFPSGGSANPSFMLMALALRAAKQIAVRCRRGALRSASPRGRHASVSRQPLPVNIQAAYGDPPR